MLMHVLKSDSAPQKVQNFSKEAKGTMLDRNVMLAFNLTLNKDGTFIQKKDGKYSLSSFEIASHVIELIYSEKTV